MNIWDEWKRLHKENAALRRLTARLLAACEAASGHIDTSWPGGARVNEQLRDVIAAAKEVVAP